MQPAELEALREGASPLKPSTAAIRRERLLAFARRQVKVIVESDAPDPRSRTTTRMIVVGRLVHVTAGHLVVDDGARNVAVKFANLRSVEEVAVAVARSRLEEAERAYDVLVARADVDDDPGEGPEAA